VGASGDKYDAIPFGTEINFFNKYVKGFHSTDSNMGSNNPLGVFAWTIKSGGAPGEGGNIMGNPYEPLEPASTSVAATPSPAAAATASNNQPSLEMIKAQQVTSGDTPELFCHTPCTPQLPPTKGSVALHASMGGVCWDLGFKDEVESAVGCQQECVATNGCRMWDYRGGRTDKRCHFCSTTDPHAGPHDLKAVEVDQGCVKGPAVCPT